MSPRRAEVGSAKLYFYAEEPHQRPHIDVIGPDWDVTIALDTLEELQRSGSPPRGDLRRVRALLRAHQDVAIYAFHETRQHRSRIPWPRCWRMTMTDIAPLIPVTDVRVLSRYIVELTFEDGAVKVIDLEPHLWGGDVPAAPG